MNLFCGGGVGVGGYEEIVIYFGAIRNWAILGVISIHFRAFLRPRYPNGNVFGGSQNFKVFLGGGWGRGGGVGMPDIPIF